MKSSLKAIALVLFAATLMLWPVLSQADTPIPTEEQTKTAVIPSQSDSCQVVIAKLDEQNKKVMEELRKIKRDVAALNQTIAEPGLSEAIAGIGYIFGLFGVAAFMASRRKTQAPRN